MPRASNGTYTAPANTAAVSGAKISSSAYNSLTSDLGNEITNSVDRGGRSPMTANLPMGGYRVTNVADAVADTDAVTLRQANAAYLPDTASSITNAYLAAAPVATLKGTGPGSESSSATITMTIASPCVVTWAGHGFSAGQAVKPTTSGTLPAGITAGRIYYVVSPTTNTFQLAETIGGTPINTSGSQSGTHVGYAYATTAERDVTANEIAPMIQPGLSFVPFATGVTIKNNASFPSTQISVSARDAYMAKSGIGNVIHSSVSLTINLSTTGANALDAGSISSSTWYYLYLISDGSTVAGLASTSASAPTLPAGYLYFLRIGAMKTDGSSALYRSKQVGNRAQYVVTAGSNTASLVQIAAGALGSTTTPTWSSVATDSFAPTAVSVRGVLINGGAVAMAAPNSDYGAYNSATNPPPAVASISAGYAVSPYDFVLESSNLYYAGGGANCKMFASGWTDNCNVVS